LEAYESPRAIAPGLWCVDGDWRGSPLRRRMTLMKLASGDLVVHSAILMAQEDLAALARLGRVRAVVIPNTLHADEGPAFAERWPGCELYAPAATARKLRRRGRADARAVEADWPPQLDREIACVPIEGTRMHEAAFVHRASRTLVLTDLCFNMPADAFSGLLRTVMRWNGVLDTFGPSRIMKLLMTSDRAALFRSLERVLALDFDRVIVGHGRILETGGPARLRDSFASRYG
jgi:hypothetical protein